MMEAPQLTAQVAGAATDVLISSAGWVLGMVRQAASQRISGTERALPRTFSRFMSEAELEAVRETGLLRGGRPGRTYFTTNKYRTVSSATEKLSLPDPAELRVDFKIKNAPNISGPEEVSGKFGRTGGGIQYYTDDPVQVEIIRIRRLR